MMLPQNHQETLSKHLDNKDSTSSRQTSDPDNRSPKELADDDIAKKIGKWTAQEDDLLRKYVPLFGEKQWRKISEHIPGRTSIQCLHRWTKILKPGLVKGPWTAEEDQKLQSWVRAEGPTKWAQCANFINGRSGKQCRERWFNNLNPNVKKGNWAKEEDELIFELYQKYGSSWSKIAKFIPGRTENAIKNRFYSTLRKLTSDKKKDQLESHEDLCLHDDVEEKGEVPGKCVRDAAVPSQAPNALYLLLNAKTSTVNGQENVKKEDSADGERNCEKAIGKSEKPHQKQAFNINGEKMIVVRDAKANEKNIQEAANKLLNTEIEDNDTAFQDFLSSLQVNLKDDFLKKEFELPKKQDDISHLDGLQKKILNFCQTNIKDLAETFKSIEPNRTSTTASEISNSDLKGRLAPQFQNSAMTVESTNVQHETSNTQGAVLIASNSTISNPQKGFSLRVPQNNKNEGQAGSPVKAQSPKGFSLYNPLKPLNKTSRNASENSSDKQSLNLGGKQLKPLQVPGTMAEVEGKMIVEKNILPLAFCMSQQQQGFAGGLGLLHKIPGNDIQETERRMIFLFQQLFSLEALLAKTKNDLVQFESNLRKNVCQENMQVKEIGLNGKRGQEYIQRPFEKMSSEFEEILKKKKVE